MPTYLHLCHKCQHQWEDFYSIKSDPPDICPNCNEKGHVERLIAGGSGRGIVELTGRDLRDHLKSEAGKIKQQAHKNENVYADLLGHDRYHSIQTQLDKKKR